MKTAASAFVLLLLAAHAAGDFPTLLGQPLSLFRDGEWGGLSYALFALLLLLGVLYTAALARAEHGGEAIVSAAAVFLLLVVTATPSWGGFHLFCSLLLLALLFGYYAALLHRTGSPWLLAHLAAPVALAGATGFHSYGLWQKALIVYFVAAAVARRHFLVRAAPASSARPARRGEPLRRRPVYRLDPGREWARRETAGPRLGAGSVLS
jgi:hypothetical protein